MALIKCTECGAEISDRAQKCPKCGCPIEEILKVKLENDNNEKKSKNKKKRKKIILIMIILFVLGIAFCGTSDDDVLDCKNDIGKYYSEFDSLLFVKANWWAPVGGENLYEAESIYEYNGVPGTLSYRYFDKDTLGNTKDKIYGVSWSPDEDIEDGIINESKINYFIGLYEGIYGEYAVAQEEKYLDYFEYIWYLDNNVEFRISVSEEKDSFSLAWVEEEQ